MASLRQTQTNGRFLVLFRFNGRQFQRALKTNRRKGALATEVKRLPWTQSRESFRHFG